MSEPSPDPSPHNPDSPFISQHVTPNTAVARVPEKIGRGALATAFLVYTGPQEFVLDFIQGVARPAQLVARVVLSPVVMDQFIAALRDNMGKFVANFGPPAALPKNPNQRPPSPQEIYDQLKIPEEMQSGQYANSVAIQHTPAEFHFDFITNFFPHGAVSARIYLAAPRVPGLVETLAGSLANWQRARGIGPSGGGGPQLQPPAGPGGPPSPPSEPPPPSPRAYPY